ncbi:MAG TPA: DegT/DnrJ/EryC1/StrS family aminotransferase [Gemmatimonadales bacterium]
MGWRYLPPVHSPLSWPAVAAGIKAALKGDQGARDRFERVLAAHHGVTRVLLTDSGTAALTLAMRLAMTATGRSRIALPAYCCYDLVTALNGARADVVLYDVDPATLGPVWSSLEAALEAQPAAVVAAHLYGLPVDMPRVMETADRHDVVVIEDAAQGLGATLGGKPLGTFGHLRVLSFGRGKGVTAGRGGALLVAPGRRGLDGSERVQDSSRGVVELVALVAQWLLARPWLYRVPASLPGLKLGDTVYRDPAPPGSMSAVAAAVVEYTWKSQSSESQNRRRNAARLLRIGNELPGLSIVLPIAPADAGWLRLPLLAPGIERADGRMRTARRWGVMPGYPQSLETLPALPPRAPNLQLPGAARLVAELWTLPTHSMLTSGDLDRLERWLTATFSSPRAFPDR